MPPARGEGRATLNLAYRGDGDFLGPDRGVCLRRGDSIEHVASGEVLAIRVPAARRALTTLRIGDRAVHVELVPGGRATLTGSTCGPWELTGNGLDVVRANGTRPGAESSLFLGAEGRLVPAQQGWCAPAVIVTEGSEHVFYLRVAHTFRVDFTGREVRTEPFDRRTLVNR